MKKLISLIFFLLLINVRLFSIVYETDTLTEFAAEIEKADKDTLVVFDVDNTLIIPDDHILRPCGKQYFKQLIIEKSSTISKEHQDLLFSYTVGKVKVAVMDPKSVDIIHNLQKRNIKTIALTAIKTGKLGIIPSMEDWRIQQLNKFNINFTPAFPQFSYIEFPELTQKGFKPVFKSGILCSACTPKGDVLAAFIKKVQLTPKKVIFIDDNIKYMESVEQSMKDMGIPFVGFLYTAAKSFPCNLDKELANFQFQHLIEHKEWLSDEKARELMGCSVER